MFHSNVATPARQRASAREIAGRWLLGATIVGALVGAVVLGMPALSIEHADGTRQSQAAQAR
ncbi:hypothetical protein ABZZ79_26365 [Streptomyces sp. NPDC006458]|uniref:hypothetical protein n=1 Tax=Streptomyces sp. NPDC006458 TaxID=3154302 RepID=UPI0033A6784D